MTISYKDLQLAVQTELLKQYPEWFNGDQGGGLYRKRAYPHLLTKFEHNLWEGIREEAVSYFAMNGIQWHSQAHNMLSSQVACLNHLFPLRKQKAKLLNILNLHILQGLDVKFVDLLPLPYEAEQDAYIGFEVVSGGDWLGEGKPSRGTNCTSLDALIYALDSLGRKWLIPIEWKYTESYAKEDKGDTASERGLVRRARYDALIEDSVFLKPEVHQKGSIYYQEPFYQLMRQALWAEQIVHQTFLQTKPELEAEFERKERFEADCVLHLHFIPEGNDRLISNPSHLPFVQIDSHIVQHLWTKCIKPQEQYYYRVVDPMELLLSIHESEESGDDEHIAYLCARYSLASHLLAKREDLRPC